MWSLYQPLIIVAQFKWMLLFEFDSNLCSLQASQMCLWCPFFVRLQKSLLTVIKIQLVVHISEKLSNAVQHSSQLFRTKVSKELLLKYCFINSSPIRNMSLFILQAFRGLAVWSWWSSSHLTVLSLPHCSTYIIEGFNSEVPHCFYFL